MVITAGSVVVLVAAHDAVVAGFRRLVGESHPTYA